ncbi:MAG TPA: MerR family transcriptional regulator [Solirubrobacteraceae bacterium]|nr:MerR family transcriptional regulator [Solirubrobacteraceae bacterium]
MAAAEGPHRIGEFSRRVGVSPELLRAWEQRYGLLRPVRSAGGFRLYGEEDARRVARMRRALEEGLSAAEAARRSLETLDSGAASMGLVEAARSRLLAAAERYDEVGIQAVLDEAIAVFGLEALVRDLILPTLFELGRRWKDGEVEVSQEHFASNLIRGRLLALARLWGRGAGPMALLACAPGEQHDISLIMFGLLLRSYGWRVLFLGTDTPLLTLEDTATTTAPAVIVLVTFDPALLEAEGTALRRLGRIAPLFLSGPGASPEMTAKIRVRRLDGDLVEAARQVAHMPNG